MLPSSVRIFVCTRPQDMRRSFDALAAIIRQEMGEEPQGGALFVFMGKSATRLKILWWDRNGFCLLYKRLHRAVFRLPTEKSNDQPAIQIDAKELAHLIAGVEKEIRQKPQLFH